MTTTQPPVDPARVLALCSGTTFIAFLDFSVVNLAFPDIGKDFPHASINTLTWIVSGYAVLFAALLAPAGRIADSIGRRTVFLVSLVAFTIASLGCGLAPTVGWLIAARFLQGAAAGGMIPAGLGLILASTPRERIPRAVGAWSMAAGFSSVIGPSVGGVLLRVFGWRSVFFINLPFGLLLLLGGLAVLPRHTRGSGDQLPDPVGSVGLGVGIACLVSALTEGDSWGWTDPRTLGLAAFGLALSVLAIARSRRHRAPAVDLGVWRSPVYRLANLGLGLLSLTMFVWMLAAPLFATAIWHWTVLETAGALSIGGVASMVGALLAGRVTGPGRHVRVAVLGCLMFAGSNAIWASSLFGSRPDFWAGWVPAAILGGGGLGLGFTCLSTLAAGTIPPLKFAGGLGMTLAVRQVGGAVGVAGLAAIMAASTRPGSLAAFHHVYAAALAANLCCALVVLGLAAVLRPARAPGPVPAAAAERAG
ncbi:MAG TPA: MFS transporter [Jatrophihabitans sp.]|nr:MFS transporter [Jatrophihabitans sp.]